VITNVGGTLGFTGVYGVSDATITRRRVEADLAVFREYKERYRGMKEACLQQLDWGVERYAKLPQPPELLELVDVPSFQAILLYISKIVRGHMAIFGTVVFVVTLILLNLFQVPHSGSNEWFFILLIIEFVLFAVFFVSGGLLVRYRARTANGETPQENARRKEAYQKAVGAAFKAADPLKAAQDHRLRCQIRELESLGTTLGVKEAKVRELLATL
jgi:hypothetical protein